MAQGKITAARVEELPRDRWLDGDSVVHVKIDDGEERKLFSFYSDELGFSSSEFIGLTRDQAHELKSKKDKQWLQSISYKVIR